ncbi:PH domain-containing protein [Raineyella sp. LH-20]|uniref:PH domain-containing protein n=1 Tax=Raineyella sp. LH-20 TaxID=3081204 RepID=UPI0029531238|nr:PH domain-containing protein [Raineyella sp. LH-20]WOP18385.1 PH domain-containing protein [Raineyella sp. LH-20]
MPVLLRVRSRAMLAAAIVVSALMLGSPLVTWFLLDPELRQQATWPELALILVTLLVIVVFVLGLGLSSVVATEEGVTITTGVIRHRYAWHEISDIRFEEGDPWVYVFTFRRDRDGDAQRRMVMAIQAPDGDRARLNAARLQELWISHRP